MATAPVYIYKGVEYYSMDELLESTEESLPHDSGKVSSIHELFLEHAGPDQKIQLHEMLDLVVAVGAMYGVDVSHCHDEKYIKRLFEKFDVDNSGYLDSNEGISMINSLWYPQLTRAGEQFTFRKEQAAEYFSATHNKWLACNISDVRNDGAEVEVDIKAGAWLSREEQRYKLRIAFSKGQAVEFYSLSNCKWLACEISDVRDDGAEVEVNIKRGAWLDREDQRCKLRIPATSRVMSVTNAPICVKDRAPTELPGRTVGLIVWNDFSWPPLAGPNGERGPWGPLDTAFGGAHMKSLMKASGVSDITELTRWDVTREKLKNAIKQVGENCGPTDTFVLYYTGHGDRLPDQDGDEEDGYDEAICTVSEDGLECGPHTYTRDDDFATWLSKYVRAQNLIIVMDCCHSGTIVDLDKPQWVGKNVVSISGCSDSEVSAGTGNGGVLTLSICSASNGGTFKKGYSTADFYNDLLGQSEYLKQKYGTGQHITLQAAVGCDPSRIAWPLVPKKMSEEKADSLGLLHSDEKAANPQICYAAPSVEEPSKDPPKLYYGNSVEPPVVSGSRPPSASKIPIPRIKPPLPVSRLASTSQVVRSGVSTPGLPLAASPRSCPSSPTLPPRSGISTPALPLAAGPVICASPCHGITTPVLYAAPMCGSVSTPILPAAPPRQRRAIQYAAPLASVSSPSRSISPVRQPVAAAVRTASPVGFATPVASPVIVTRSISPMRQPATAVARVASPQRFCYAAPKVSTSRTCSPYARPAPEIFAVPTPCRSRRHALAVGPVSSSSSLTRNHLTPAATLPNVLQASSMRDEIPMQSVRSLPPKPSVPPQALPPKPAYPPPHQEAVSAASMPNLMPPVIVARTPSQRPVNQASSPSPQPVNNSRPEVRENVTCTAMRAESFNKIGLHTDENGNIYDGMGNAVGTRDHCGVICTVKGKKIFVEERLFSNRPQLPSSAGAVPHEATASDTRTSTSNSTRPSTSTVATATTFRD